ncbi:MAG: hypothetical protein ABIE94_01735 [archaeon]
MEERRIGRSRQPPFYTKEELEDLIIEYIDRGMWTGTDITEELHFKRREFYRVLAEYGLVETVADLRKQAKREWIASLYSDMDLSLTEVIHLCGSTIPQSKTPREKAYDIATHYGCLKEYNEFRSWKAEQRQGREDLVRMMYNSIAKLLSNLQNAAVHQDPAVDNYGGPGEDQV